MLSSLVQHSDWISPSSFPTRLGSGSQFFFVMVDTICTAWMWIVIFLPLLAEVHTQSPSTLHYDFWALVLFWKKQTHNRRWAVWNSVQRGRRVPLLMCEPLWSQEAHTLLLLLLFLNEIYEVVPCSGSIAKTGRRISVSCRGFLVVHWLAHCMFRTALVENTGDHGLVVVFHLCLFWLLLFQVWESFLL